MAVLLSLLTAGIFGVGDFFGGLATRRARVTQVVLGSHGIGLVGATVAALLLAEEFTAIDFGLGMAGGAFGGIGVGLLYRGLGRGPMSVVAPVTAITSAAVPAAWGVLGGDSLTVAGWAGVGLAIVSIGLVSSADSEADSAPVTPQVIAEALAAGAGFGIFFIFMDATEGATAPWPTVGARTITTGTLLVFLLATRRPLVASAPGALGLILVAGVLDTTSNVLFLYATDQGQLTIVSVLSSLYPVATVLLARAVLHERLTAAQLTGCTAAIAATALIAVG